MVIDKNTQLCISVSSSPGTTGSRIHNHLHRKHRLNFIYKPFVGDNIREVIQAVRTLGIRGCGISMPFKTGVIHYLDDIDEQARIVSVVNTVVNNDGHLMGYNTDIDGAYLALKNMGVNHQHTVTIHGAGATAHSTVMALARIGTKSVKIKNRTVNRSWSLKRFIDDNLPSISAEVVHDFQPADLFINCTSIGMNDQDSHPITTAELTMMGGYVMDVVNRDTDLVKRASKYFSCVRSGRAMAIYQSILQFQLYTKTVVNIADTFSEIDNEVL